MNVKIKTFILGIILSLFVLSACTARTPQPAPATASPQPSQVDSPAGSLDTMLSSDDPAYAGPDETQSKAAEIVRSLLAAQLKVDASSLQLAAVEPIDWNDACLGEAQEGETCTQVVTPGFRITFTYDGQNYIFHTDLSAGLVRPETHVSQVS